MLKKNTFNRISLICGILLYTIISLYIINYNHHFYDDEIFNISKLKLNIVDLVTIIQNSDVHPPLSYILNKIIFDFFDSYFAILVCSIVINVSILAYFYITAINYLYDICSKLVLFNAVFLNGAFLMWTNSVRWYAYWVPLAILVYTILLKKRKLSPLGMLWLTVVLSLMTYINYLSFLYVISLFVLLLLCRREDFNFKNILVAMLTYTTLSFYQIKVFWEVHVNNSHSQTSNLLNSILNCIYGVVNGGSVFISNPLFLIFSLMVLLILIYGIYSYIKDKSKRSKELNQSQCLFFTMCLFMILSGVAAKFRNSFFLSIPFYYVISIFVGWLDSKKLKSVFVLFVYMLSLLSIHNIVTRNGTAKKSYNLPVAEIKKHLSSVDRTTAFTYDPTIKFYLEELGYNVAYLYETAVNGTLEKGQTIVLLETYQGALRDLNYSDAMTLYKEISYCLEDIDSINIGKDLYYNFKNKLPGNRPKVPEVLISLTVGIVKEDCSYQSTTVPAF